MSLDYANTLVTRTGESGYHLSAVHNGEHDMSATLTYTVRKYDPSAPEGWAYALHTVSTAPTFDIQNLVITGTAPENPEPIIRNAGENGTPPGPTNVRVSFTCAYRKQVNASLRVLNSKQKLMAALSVPAMTDAGSASFTWNGTGNPETPDDPATYQPLDGAVWLFQSYIEGDTDKSTTLLLEEPEESDQPGEVHYNIASSFGRTPGEGCVRVFTPEGTDVGTIELHARDLTPGYHCVGLKIYNTDFHPHYVAVVCVRDADAAFDRGHRERWALQHNDAPPKHYISGTNCVFALKLKDATPTKVMLNDDEVYYAPPGTHSENPVPGSIVFASTHFRDGETVVATAFGAPSVAGGPDAVTEKTFVVYNKYGLQFMPAQTELPSRNTPDIAAAFETLNHKPAWGGANSRISGPGPGDPRWDYDKASFLKMCQTATVIDFMMHGNLNFLSPFDHTVLDGDGKPIGVSVDEIKEAMRARSPDVPLPINLVFVESCAQGGYNPYIDPKTGLPLPNKPARLNNLMPGAFGFSDLADATSDDRAFVGFDVATPIPFKIRKTFWESILKGTTVKVAVAAAQNAYDAEFPGGAVVVSGKPRVRAILLIHGDPNTTMGSVYGGTRPDDWYRRVAR